MGNGDDRRCVFPLTSLQIGDLQSYLSDLSLFLAIESEKFYILVDNRPWLRELGSRPARLWQLMVTKSRLSPFANTKARRRNYERESYQRPEISEPKNFMQWFSLINALPLSRKKLLLPVLPVKNLRQSFILNSQLHRTLYGFIVFEVTWENVRGINYLNELQTDTSLAIEAKCMRRWEFDCISQAAGCISSWFSGSSLDQQLLKDYLESVSGEVFYDAKDVFHDAEDNVLSSVPIVEDEIVCYSNLYISPLECSDEELNLHSPIAEDSPRTPRTPRPMSGPNKRRKVLKSISLKTADDSYLKEGENNIGDFPSSSEIYAANCQEALEATEYKDVLILFRFSDGDLPFKLGKIIMSDLRLLTLLEAGLPSWVIFLQSYPVFCHIYRPWMCPFARALYVLISIITVLIGFYDLYKNVPLLKAAASRLCGPLFDWIETWEMVSRIKYLGTMLFLHNFEKAVVWFLTISRTTRSFLSVIAQPLAAPIMELFGFLIPIGSLFIEVVGNFFSVIWDVTEFCWNLVGDLIELFVSPIWLILSTLWSFVTFILFPIFWIVSEVLYAPIRMVFSLASFIANACTCLYGVVGDIRLFLSSIFRVASVSEATVVSTEISVLRTLWNDLFSQVFRALRSILHGLVAFFTACNRHRLSIYNHIQEYCRRIFGPMESESRSGRGGLHVSQKLATVYEKSVEKRKVHED